MGPGSTVRAPGVRRPGVGGQGYTTVCLHPQRSVGRDIPKGNLVLSSGQRCSAKKSSEILLVIVMVCLVSLISPHTNIHIINII